MLSPSGPGPGKQGKQGGSLQKNVGDGGDDDDDDDAGDDGVSNTMRNIQGLGWSPAPR